MRKIRSIEERISLINQCRTSGMSDGQWCRLNNISSSTFYTWVKNLHQLGYVFPDPVKASDYAPEANEVVMVSVVPDNDNSESLDCVSYQNTPIYNSPVPLESKRLTKHPLLPAR